MKSKSDGQKPNLMNKHMQSLQQSINDFVEEMKLKGGGCLQLDKFTKLLHNGVMNLMVSALQINSKLKLLLWHEDMTAVKVINAEVIKNMAIKCIDSIGIRAFVMLITDGGAAEVAAREMVLLHYNGKCRIWVMCCAAHAWDLVIEAVIVKAFLKCVLQIVNRIVTFVYAHGFVKALWAAMEVTGIPRAAGSRFATLFITLTAVLKNEVALRTLFKNTKLVAWINSAEGLRHKDKFLVMQDCVASARWWRKIQVSYHCVLLHVCVGCVVCDIVCVWVCIC